MLLLRKGILVCCCCIIVFFLRKTCLNWGRVDCKMCMMVYPWVTDSCQCFPGIRH